jgi:ornithine cyclodeaminase/alanine dehydrogenase-like protein (mu-crystallin family)
MNTDVNTLALFGAGEAVQVRESVCQTLFMLPTEAKAKLTSLRVYTRDPNDAQEIMRARNDSLADSCIFAASLLLVTAWKAQKLV